MLSTSLYYTSITLLPKFKREIVINDHYTPITIMNIDMKILIKILPNEYNGISKG